MDPDFEADIIKRLKQEFNNHDIDFEEFCNLLITNNAFLSGSFLLQVIQNRFFDDIKSDIDIYTFGDINTSLENNIQKLINGAVAKKFNKNKIYSTEYSYVVTNDINEPKNIFNIEKINNNTNKLESNYKYDISNYKVNIINKYNGINKCNTIEVGIEDYRDTWINHIVDFEAGYNIICKYQLIYYDELKYQKPTDIIANFDFDFCANYFDGKNVFVQNYDSIKLSSSILNLKQPRIYKNENRRIIKYIKRGYEIKAKYNDDIYEILYINENINNILVNIPLPDNLKNLIIICEHQSINIDNLLNNLPLEIEKVIIYTYPHDSIINNLPSGIKELRLYIWKEGSGTSHNMYSTEKYKIYEKGYRLRIEYAIDNIKKVPLNCDIYINDELIIF